MMGEGESLIPENLQDVKNVVKTRSRFSWILVFFFFYGSMKKFNNLNFFSLA